MAANPNNKKIAVSAVTTALLSAVLFYLGNRYGAVNAGMPIPNSTNNASADGMDCITGFSLIMENARISHSERYGKFLGFPQWLSAVRMASVLSIRFFFELNFFFFKKSLWKTLCVSHSDPCLTALWKTACMVFHNVFVPAFVKLFCMNNKRRFSYAARSWSLRVWYAAVRLDWRGILLAEVRNTGEYRTLHFPNADPLSFMALSI